MKQVKSIIVLLFLFVGNLALMAQTRVSGIVTDGNGEPLPGVNIIEKGTNNGAITSYNGEYTIVVSEGAVLSVSCIGYTAVEAKVSGPRMNFTLDEDNLELAELVVVGFAVQKKVNLTGSVSTISSEQLNTIPVSNAVQALQGQIPGLNISRNSGWLNGRGTSMDVRGIATIGEGSSGGALVLIDGIESDLSALNASDIESVTVLKDAAASSIYGSRAPFGVILVTTKQGEKGKAKVSYNGDFRWNTPMNMLHMADSYSWALYFNDCAHNDGYGDDISASRLQRIKDYQDGTISYNTIPLGNKWANAYNDSNDNIDYYDVLFSKVNPAQEHNVSVSGATEKLNYFVSGSFLKESGVMNWDLDGLQRINVLGKFSAQVNDKLRVSYSSRYVRSDYHQPLSLDESRFWYLGQYCWPVAPLYDPNGNLFNDTVLLLRDGGQSTTTSNTFTHQAGMVWEPLKNWRIVADASYRNTSEGTRDVTLPVYQKCVDNVNNGDVWNIQSAVAEYMTMTDYVNASAYTDYTVSSGGHNIKAMAGFQTEYYFWRKSSAQKVGLIVNEIPTINTASGVFNGENVPPVVSGSYASWRTAGFFGRINYNYKERYLLEANLRYDGTSRFRAANRWGLFPSVSLGWNIAKEEFLSSANWLETLKLRASYGTLGNQNTSSYYPTYATMGYANSAGSWLLNGEKTNIAWPASLVSSILTWEDVVSYNVGFDFGMFGGKLSGSADIFVRNTTNMVGPADELPVILGTSVPKTNNTDLSTRGFEFEIAWKDVLPFGLSYGVRGLLSDSRTWITRYSNPSQSLSNYYEGKELGEIWGYTTIGIAKTDAQMQEHLATLPNGGQGALGSGWQAGDIMYKDVNEDGKISSGKYTLDDHGDLTRIGNSTPRFRFGLDITAQWKGIDFRAFFQGVAKRDYYQWGKYFYGSCGWSKWGTTVLTQHLDYFRDDPSHPLGENLDSYYPRPYFDQGKNVNCQTRYLQNAAYMRLKNVQIGYTIPRNWTSKLGVDKLRIYFSGENLFTITKMSSLFDPETIGVNDQGSSYPLSKTYSGGISITF